MGSSCSRKQITGENLSFGIHVKPTKINSSFSLMLDQCHHSLHHCWEINEPLDPAKQVCCTAWYDFKSNPPRQVLDSGVCKSPLIFTDDSSVSAGGMQGNAAKSLLCPSASGRLSVSVPLLHRHLQKGKPLLPTQPAAPQWG